MSCCGIPMTLSYLIPIPLFCQLKDKSEVGDSGFRGKRGTGVWRKVKNGRGNGTEMKEITRELREREREGEGDERKGKRGER